MIEIKQELAHKIMRRILTIEKQNLDNKKNDDDDNSVSRTTIVKNIRKILEEEIDAITID